MLCVYCGRQLSEAQDMNNGQKSCPKCSQLNTNKKHVYYPESDFGHTDKRITRNNPEGIQSWCQKCRGENYGPHANGTECC